MKFNDLYIEKLKGIKGAIDTSIENFEANKTNTNFLNTYGNKYDKFIEIKFPELEQVEIKTDLADLQKHIVSKQGKSFTFDENTQTILTLDHNNQSTGRKTPIELESVNAYPDITTQLQRYVDWIKQYYLPNRPSDIEPMIVSREITDKTTSEYQNVINAFNQFDNRNNTLPLRYIEFSVDCNGQTITFNEIVY